MTTTATSTSASTTALPVPRWAVIAAHVAAVSPLLSSLWRLPLIFGFTMGLDGGLDHPFWVRASYLIGLGVLSEGLAFLTIGLVRPWGEVVPRWVPILRGRAIPAALVVVTATVGGLAATALFTTMAIAWPGNFDGIDGWVVLQTVCYVPLIAWGPCVLAVTWTYWRRRRVLAASQA